MRPISGEQFSAAAAAIVHFSERGQHPALVMVLEVLPRKLGSFSAHARSVLVQFLNTFSLMVLAFCLYKSKHLK